ncbi:hypothetical protein FGO68_gene2361 [Halteria grandinella]|uniref:Uncharacterized protein n=1 Tax=Halteria grandinella TaxID=5974 RepID=A0A8J8NR87_HALGN|nr:hypothetical protein FGO68_gene2361 [Halteria grandinella]
MMSTFNPALMMNTKAYWIGMFEAYYLSAIELIDGSKIECSSQENTCDPSPTQQNGTLLNEDLFRHFESCFPQIMSSVCYSCLPNEMKEQKLLEHLDRIRGHISASRVISRMDHNLFETLSVFIRLYFASASNDLAKKYSIKKEKRLKIQAKHVLRSQNMDISLAALDLSKSSQDHQVFSQDDLCILQEQQPTASTLMTFNEWLHAIVVRPFGPLMPEIVKKVIESLELEDVRIEMDLELHSKQRSKAFQQSRKRKIEDVNSLSQPCGEVKNQLAFVKPIQIAVAPAFKRRQLIQQLEDRGAQQMVDISLKLQMPKMQVKSVSFQSTANNTSFLKSDPQPQRQVQLTHKLDLDLAVSSAKPSLRAKSLSRDPSKQDDVSPATNNTSMISLHSRSQSVESVLSSQPACSVRSFKPEYTSNSNVSMRDFCSQQVMSDIMRRKKRIMLGQSTNVCTAKMPRQQKQKASATGNIIRLVTQRSINLGLERMQSSVQILE